MRNSEERFASWIAWMVMGLLLLLAGCQGMTSGTKPGPQPGPTPPPTPVSTPPAPTASLSANPASIQQGQSTTLTWQTQNATQVSLEGIGSVNPSGSLSVQPSQSTTYELTATGPGGSANANAGVVVSMPPAPPPPPPPQYSLQSIQHIVFMLQENRSFDSYFGHLPQYWAAHGYPPVQFDAEPANASNPSYDGTGTVSAYHLATVCTQNQSPFWGESHVDWDRENNISPTPLLDGFTLAAGNDARQAPSSEQPIYDVNGIRAMGYYTDAELNYYYFMASNFATSDRWFSPLMSRSDPNRLYLFAASSMGHVYPPKVTFSNKTIFDLLNAAGVSWKIYVTDPGATYASYFQPFANLNSANIVPATQYLTDLQNGTLPEVALIESGYQSGRDEHPNNNIQTGAAYAASMINALMASSSWKSSVFILSYDEAGGFYDHVPPQPAVSPDGIPPSDLQPGDTCYGMSPQTPTCDFTHTGYRVPVLVISPFTRKHYVSHNVADYTAILKFIETRFKLPSLTQRDAAQMDMTEFFDFQDAPWLTPPSPPGQLTNGTCNVQALQ